MKLETLLQSGKPITADGGMGTMLMALGLIQGQSPELWNRDHPEKIRQVHRQYIEAGAQIILTNSFGGNNFRLKAHGNADKVAELNSTAARLARLEADAADHPVVVAGSMGPLGIFFEPMGTLTEAQAVEAFAGQAAALYAGGVDLFWIETMSDLAEVQAAITGCQQAAPGVPIVATMTFDTKGRTMMGTTPEKAANTLAGLGVIGFGANCGNGPREIETVIGKMHAATPQRTLVAKANAGLPHIEHGVAIYDAKPEDMGVYARQVLQSGARIIGACCGSTPAHIKAIYEALQSE